MALANTRKNVIPEVKVETKERLTSLEHEILLLRVELRHTNQMYSDHCESDEKQFNAINAKLLFGFGGVFISLLIIALMGINIVHLLEKHV
jgi:hypothetical protein